MTEALSPFTIALQRSARAQWKADRYHATTTVPSLLLITERLDDSHDLAWRTFAARHPDRFAQNPSILSRYYRHATLRFRRAHRVFVMPDLASADRERSRAAP